MRGEEVEEGGFTGEGGVVGVWGGDEFEDVGAFFGFSNGVGGDGGVLGIRVPDIIVGAVVLW